MIERSYCSTLSPELQEAERQCYRAQCRVRCLEANLDRITPDEFEPLMAALEVANIELEAAIRQMISVQVHNACQK